MADGQFGGWTLPRTGAPVGAFLLIVEVPCINLV
jgi:hypothetical protein